MRKPGPHCVAWTTANTRHQPHWPITSNACGICGSPAPRQPRRLSTLMGAASSSCTWRRRRAAGTRCPAGTCRRARCLPRNAWWRYASRPRARSTASACDCGRRLRIWFCAAPRCAFATGWSIWPCSIRNSAGHWHAPRAASPAGRRLRCGNCWRHAVAPAPSTRAWSRPSNACSATRAGRVSTRWPARRRSACAAFNCDSAPRWDWRRRNSRG
jgi:hypothetical protein